jgi:HEXXH motif-containing protein
MSTLVERVTAALRNPGDSPWLPGLATGLAERGWADLYDNTGLTPSEYGTARVMAGDCSTPRKLVSVIPVALSVSGSAQVFQIELLSEDTSRRYEESGVRFYSEEEILNGLEISGRLTEAINTLKLAPAFLSTVATLVRSVHLIDAGSDDYDVSFSEPNISFSIFVSIPRSPSQYGALRVAEAILHEAMHLQLTLIERIVTLIKPCGGGYFSPWRGEYRTAQGVLHALYVFRVVDCFFGELLNKKPVSSKYFEYLNQRKYEIACQTNEIREFSGCPELTDLGKDFVKRLIVKAE